MAPVETCVNREFVSITKIVRTTVSISSSPDRIPEPIFSEQEIDVSSQPPLCGVLKRSGSHMSLCPTPELSGALCPYAQYAAGELTREELPAALEQLSP